MITITIIIPVVMKYHVGLGWGIAVSHGHVGVLGFDWQPS